MFKTLNHKVSDISLTTENCRYLISMVYHGKKFEICMPCNDYKHLENYV